MTLVKTSLLNGIAVLIKMATLLGINKVLAIYVGPNGYAALGQFQNAIQMIGTFASGAVSTGVTKYTAEYHDNEAAQWTVWRTASMLALLGSLFAGIAIAFFNREIASLFLKDAGYGGVFIWFAATLALFAFNSLLLAILNGRREIGRYVLANIAGSILALVATSVMTVLLGLYGALIALATYQSLAFFATVLICFKTPWLKLRYLFGPIERSAIGNLAKFGLMAAVSALCAPASHILVRNYIGVALNWDAAGYWEAIWRLSAAYLMVVTTTLAVYYLPRLSALNDISEIRHEIIQGYKIILPISAFGGMTVYLFRDFIINLLFTPTFLPMRELFAWQMLGDTLKIGGWVLGYLAIGKALVRLFVLTEICFSANFFLLTWIFIRALGLKGVAVAHAVNYLLYWGVMALSVHREMSVRRCKA